MVFRSEFHDFRFGFPVAISQMGDKSLPEIRKATVSFRDASSDQRCERRRLVHAAGTISTEPDDQEHVAWIKDLTNSGLCLFTRYRPEIGMRVRVTLSNGRLDPKLPRDYCGKVIRVQEFGENAALAVAVLFTEAV